MYADMALENQAIKDLLGKWQGPSIVDYSDKSSYRLINLCAKGGRIFCNSGLGSYFS